MRFALSALSVGATLLSLLVLPAGAAQARDQIRIVGSSTVFPFSTAVAEQFGRTSGFKTPIVEATGSGGGLKLFCQGVGAGHPDITNASRRIKDGEIKLCAQNGVTDILEVKIGYDGIVVANIKGGPEFELSKKQLWLALAKEVPQDGKMVPNPYVRWCDISEDLDCEDIEVLGPPPTSGTRDAFVELVMEKGCHLADGFDEVMAAEGRDEKQIAGVCSRMREDGHFIDAGENDNLIVQKLLANPVAVGIFGFSFLDQNWDKIQPALVDGVEPTFENIADGTYAISRSMFFYVKKAHIGVIPGLAEYVAEFASEQAFGPDGYLVDKGLIPLPDDARAEVIEEAQAILQ